MPKTPIMEGPAKHQTLPTNFEFPAVMRAFGERKAHPLAAYAEELAKGGTDKAYATDSKEWSDEYAEKYFNALRGQLAPHGLSIRVVKDDRPGKTEGLWLFRVVEKRERKAKADA